MIRWLVGFLNPLRWLFWVWTTPPSVATLTPISKTAFGDVVRDDFLYLLNRPAVTVKWDNGANYTTTSTTFVDVDATNLKITLTISGTAVLVGFTVMTTNNTSFDILVDGTRFASAGADGLLSATDASLTKTPASASVLVTGLTPGAHTFKLQWKVPSGTGTLFAGAGSAGTDYIPTMFAVEVG